MRYVVICILLTLFSAGNKLWSQYYRLGQNPSKTKWSQINTMHFQVIFPKDHENAAQYVTHKLEQVYDTAAFSMGESPKKISIILQTKTVSSNGFVVWAPRRSEFFMTPPQDNDVVPWIDLLAIHEYRHIVQISNLNKGLTKVINWLLGEQGTGAILGLTTPIWFLEGDATLTETLLSEGGRGRLPHFDMGLRAQLYDLGVFSYNKAQFGSFNHLVPNHYQLGYHLSVYARRQYGMDIWKNVVARIGKFPLLPFRFSSAVKKETRYSSQQLYRMAINELDSTWKSTLTLQQITSYDGINKRNNEVPLSYRLPQVFERGGVLLAKSGYDIIPALVLIDSLGREEQLCKFGSYFMNALSANSHRAIWAEQRPDPRWEYQSYSVLVEYDFEKRKKNQLTKKTKLFAPAISDNNEKIVAVEIPENGLSALVVLDGLTFEESRRLSGDSRVLYRLPAWNEGANKVVAIRNSERGNEIVSWDISSNVVKVLYGPVKINLNHPQFYQDGIIFHSSVSGVDNIYYLNAQGGTVQLTGSKYGAFEAFCYKNTLFYVDYSAKGYDLVKTDFSSALEQGIHDIKYTPRSYYLPLLAEESALSATINTDSSYSVRKYRKGLHLINIHSWQPISGVSDEEFNPQLGLRLLSQDKLSTTVITGGYKYVPTQNMQRLEAKVEYDEWYPKLSVDLSNNRFDQLFRFIEGDHNEDTLWSNELRNNQAAFNAFVPLNLTRNEYNQGMGFEIGALHYENKFYDNDELLLHQHLWALSLAHTYSRRLKKSFRAITSNRELGYQLQMRSSAVSGTWLSQWSAAYWLKVPFFFKHHVLSLYGAYERNNLLNSGFRNQRSIARGYTLRNYSKGFTGRVDYIFPLCYPDWDLGFLAYLQRVKARLFADASLIEHDNESQWYRTLGIDISTDLNLLRYWPLFELGLRSSYLLDHRSSLSFNLIFGVSL